MSRRWEQVVAEAVARGGVRGGAHEGEGEGAGSGGGGAGGDAALKAAQDRAAAAEAELTKARAEAKAREDAEEKAKADAEAKAAADLAAKGGAEAKRLHEEAVKRAEAAEAELVRYREKEKQRLDELEKQTVELFGKLPERTREKISPFKSTLPAEAWAQLVRAEAAEAGGPSLPPVILTPRPTASKETFIPERTRQLLDDHGYSDKSAKALIVAEEEDPVNGGRAVVMRHSLRTMRELQTPHTVFHGTAQTLLERQGHQFKQSGGGSKR